MKTLRRTITEYNLRYHSNTVCYIYRKGKCRKVCMVNAISEYWLRKHVSYININVDGTANILIAD